jgi:hypothetical protein
MNGNWLLAPGMDRPAWIARHGSPVMDRSSWVACHGRSSAKVRLLFGQFLKRNYFSKKQSFWQGSPDAIGRYLCGLCIKTA